MSNLVPANAGAFQAITPGTVQNISFAGSSTAVTNPFQASTNLIRLLATQACYVAFASSPTATSSSMQLAANIPEYFGVTPGTKVAALQVSSAGTLNITEGA